MEQKLPADFKAKWLDALRSGRYEQTEGFLSRGGGFCCLGVALDLLDPEGWRGEQGSNARASRHGRTGFPSPIDLPPEISRVMNARTDITDSNEGIKYTVMRFLGHMNDSGMTFAEIANWIEREL